MSTGRPTPGGRRLPNPACSWCGHDHTDGCPWCDCPEPARGFPWPWVAGLALLLILLLNLL